MRMRMVDDKKNKVESGAEDFFLEYCRANAEDLHHGYLAMKQQIKNLLFVLERCHSRNHYKSLLDFLESCSYFFYDMGYWQERLNWAEKGYDAALHLSSKDAGENHRAAKCAYWIGWFHCRGEKYEGASVWAEKSHHGLPQRVHRIP